MRQESQNNLHQCHMQSGLLQYASVKRICMAFTLQSVAMKHAAWLHVGTMFTGWAVQEKAKRGFLEDFRIGLELATTAVFDAVRWLVRKALFMPEKQTFTPLGMEKRFQNGAAIHEVLLLLPMEHTFLQLPFPSSI